MNLRFVEVMRYAEHLAPRRRLLVDGNWHLGATPAFVLRSSA